MHQFRLKVIINNLNNIIYFLDRIISNGSEIEEAREIGESKRKMHLSTLDVSYIPYNPFIEKRKAN